MLRNAWVDEIVENRIVGVEEYALEIIKRELFKLLLVVNRK